MATLNRPILKQAWELCADDLERYPVWVCVHGRDEQEPWYDDTDEATFRPWQGELPVHPEGGSFLISAEFETRSGQRFPGTVRAVGVAWTPEARGHIGQLQPCLFAQGRRFSFWGGRVGIPEEEQKAFFEAMGQTAEQIFPLRCSALPGLVDGELTGTVGGFSKLKREAFWAGSRQQELLDGVEMLRAQIRKLETPD
jgi:hypothetical protein